MSPDTPPYRPTRAEMEAARGRSIPDVLAPNLRVLFCGINPSLYSGATGYHFARPGNRFWPALHRSGFTSRQLRPHEQGELPRFGLGVTNLVGRTTARANELTTSELREGARRLLRLTHRYRPHAVAVVGVTAYRTSFARPRAEVGAQPEPLGDALLWILPNPSGINAHYQLPDLAAEFHALRERAAG